MNEIALQILLSMSMLLGVGKTSEDPNWKVLSPWSESDGISSFSAELKNINKNCSDNKTLVFPMLIHGAHEIFVDGKIIASFGDPTFRKSAPFYLKPALKCSEINGDTLTWKVSSYSQYFARFNTYPQIVTDNPSKIILLHEIFNIIAGSGLVLLCFITSIIFFTKIENDVFFANILANLGFASYFLFSCANYFMIDITMLNAHKIADIGVWIGIASFFYIVHHLQLCSKKSFSAIIGFSMTACLIIALANDGDTIQFGTSMPFPILIIGLIEATGKSILNLRKNFLSNILRTISVLFFFSVGINEILLVVGVTESSPLLSVGILGALVAMTLIVQAGISLTYKQRDELLTKLESKVEERTIELSNALKEKELAQAELIQSAKLASLGTLSAGIAHEINNNINYINACIIGLEKEIGKVTIENKQKVEKLISAIKHGTKMTIDIVNSLRNYTGLNQAKNKTVEFKEIVSSVKNIIKRKLLNIKLIEDYDEDTFIECNVVGINQLVMNLLTNAIDAMEEQKGIITISAHKSSQFLNIKVSDNGNGIPDNIRDKIFDPFFTTKDVGSGTGLGLHIVKKEIDTHHGTIQVQSEIGVGTTFFIKLPINSQASEAA